MNTKKKKVICFEHGLRDDLRLAIVVLELKTYHEVLAKVVILEVEKMKVGG